MRLIVSILVFVQVLAQINGAVHYVKFHQDPQTESCIIIADEEIKTFRGFKSDDENAVQTFAKPAVQGPADAKMLITDSSQIVEVFARREAIAQAHVDLYCKTREQVQEFKPSDETKAEPEVVKIIDGGDQSNRIDVVFMGDGYQAAERQEFFDDMARLTKDMFEGVTFRSWLPLFNIWAIYEESVDSGIGYNGPKNTPFRLYRESGQLRGILPGNSAHARTVCRLTGTSGCDYPSIIGNDDFYGGLGGEFVISTRSNRTGTVVLRHEMGHNFVDVGEEYDNGQVYSGVNAARTVAGLGWKSWLSGVPAKEEKAIYRLSEYPWADLSRGQQSFTFRSDGTYARWYLLVSVSAAGEEDCLEFVLDGEVLPWTSHGFDDREFYDWYGEEGFSSGTHTFTVRSKTPSTHPDIPRMICSINIHEFGPEGDFHIANDYVSAYPTWDVYGRKTFRPTNAGCLMRNMSSPTFCPICQEGMWYQFLARVSLIDDVQVSSTGNPDGTKDVTLNTLKLGSLRAPGNEVPGERLDVRWALNGAEQVNLRDQFTVQAQPGQWSVSVVFNTPEIRTDPNGLTSESKSFTV